MQKLVHDKRPFYDRQKEPIVDPEWDEAERKNEPAIYYWEEMLNGGRCVKKYKPAIANLLEKRCGVKLIPMKGESK